MKLAVNWSPQAERLLLDGKIDVDLWKCADWPELVEPALKTKPAYVHFPLRAGGGTTPDWNAVRAWMEKTGTKNVNMHLHVTPKDFPDIPFRSDSAEHRDRVIDAMVRDVEAAGREFGIERIIVENLPSTPEDDGVHPLHSAIHAETVRTVIERTGCGLLLDLDHAMNATHLLGLDTREYIESLPVDRIGELHMSGTLMQEGSIHGHNPMTANDWLIFDWAIERMRAGAWKTPEIYAFEYGGIGENFKHRSDPVVLAEQVPMLFAKVHSLNK